MNGKSPFVQAMRPIQLILSISLALSSSQGAIAASKNHYWMLSPSKEYQQAELLLQQQNFPQAYSHFANAKAAGHQYAGIMMALFYKKGLGNKAQSNAIAAALLNEAEEHLSKGQIEAFVAKQQRSYPKLKFQQLLALLK